MKQIKIFADTGSLEQLETLVLNPIIEGFTTNPTLLAKAGVKDYEKFAHDAINLIQSKKPNASISLEVFDDHPVEIVRQAKFIHHWSKTHNFNIYVKIPILNVDGTYLTDAIKNVAKEGISVNVTCVTTAEQYNKALAALDGTYQPHIISVFAGRIADVGIDPMTILEDCRRQYNVEKLWASSREVFNIFQAEEAGCHIITMTPDLIAKIPNIGKHLRLVSLDTSKMFFNDAKATGFKL